MRAADSEEDRKMSDYVFNEYADLVRGMGGSFALF